MTDAMTIRAPGAGTLGDEPHPRRWLALAVIAVTVLLVILDATIVNIALPAVSSDLGISAASQQWIVTAYTLTFGGPLLLGGRIADFWGRKRTYLVGAAGFAVASPPRAPRSTWAEFYSSRSVDHGVVIGDVGVSSRVACDNPMINSGEALEPVRRRRPSQRLRAARALRRSL